MLIGDPADFEKKPSEWVWSGPLQWNVLDMDFDPDIGTNLCI